MAKSFKEPLHYEHEIAEGTTKIGTLRIKPNGILWKPAGQQKFHNVTLDTFTTWITGTIKGKRMTES